jgi:two-component system sensor histidine kinase/response regulator
MKINLEKEKVTGEEITKIERNDIKNFIDQFGLDFKVILSLKETLKHTLNKEERDKIIEDIMNQTKITLETCTNFLLFIRENLHINYSPADLFIIDIMHSLKNSVGSIWTLAQLLIKEEDIDSFQTFISMFDLAEERSYELLNNLNEINLSGYKINLLKVNLNKSINKAIDNLELIAKEKNINIININKDNISTLTDQEIIESSLLNIIANAIKFSYEDGDILISISKDNNFIYINIEDNGIGIKKEKQQDLFNSLGKTTSGTKQEVGTGIGLYSTAKILKEVGAEISVRSDGEGKGSVFTIKLPIK